MKETQLQQGLARLRTRFLVMCAAVGIALDEACEAFSLGDMDRAHAVVSGDADINALENEIDGLALSLLARNQPVAQDLRCIVAALRMVLDLERIGDEAVSIAERALILRTRLPEPMMEGIHALMTMGHTLYTQATDAFRAEDAAKALQICRNDDESTQMEVRALHHIMDHVHNTRGERLDLGMHGILVCRALNRVCRRSANIAEQTYFICQGVNIKHIPLPPAGNAPCL